MGINCATARSFLFLSVPNEAVNPLLCTATNEPLLKGGQILGLFRGVYGWGLLTNFTLNLMVKLI